MAQGPTIRRLQLGRELKRLREGTGLLRDAAAEDLGRDASTISKIENGKMTISLGDVKSLLMLYGVPLDSDDARRLLDVAKEARKRSTHRVPDWVRAFVGFEAEASEIRDYETSVVPGLLQTESYIRALTQAGDPTRDPAEVDRLVAIRQERQARLTSGTPPRLWMVMGEAVIRRLAGFDPSVQREQLEHLRAVADLPNVSLRIIPFSARPHPALGAAFQILTLPEPTGHQVVYLEDLWSADYVDRDAQVTEYTQVFDRICDAALTPTGTAQMIDDTMGELR
ncbi:helix-turn-helix domain-containing protein [Pseudonocardia sp. HH130630-07]|uniref:helix-turn-helix domain-containing protein n=1 Tax=Pseudonocardia sp. HH130630-07 TaxID=1690815 RepID=UPI000814D5D8|nr:helix-turn-helix transcriptional regulator [Pseudonocardia sp. HH130630-07]ANY08227.1 hypothetical protein AFB00_20285 [Pseudonocardia sp. HH130630-07]